MKGAFFLGNREFEVRDMEKRPLAADEVRIRVMACGVCGTDVHIYHGSAMAPASKGSSGASLKHCAAGAALYCANPPSRVTPSACRCSQNCFLPSRQGVQAPQ